MPGSNASGGPQVELRDVFALLFAALCGLLLGVAAAPTLLPMLGFAGFAPYVESHRDAERASLQVNRSARVTPAVSATPLPTHVASNPLTTNRLLFNRPPSVNQPVRTGLPSPSTISPSLALQTLFGFGLLALAIVLWLRRDMFAVLLCRWAKDPRQWRGTAEAALVNAKCVLYLEGNAYRLGAEFFTQAVEVRYSPLFVRINARGSDRAIIVPRRMPRLAAARRSSRRRAASN
jgi:hypothetical protein